jgi:hypothetical protein
MANEQTTTTTAPVVETPVVQQIADTGASTQSTSTQAEVAQISNNPLNTKLTPEVAVVKPVVPKEAVKPTLEQMASKIDYREMISKHIEEEGGLTDEDFGKLEAQGLDKEHFLMMADAQKTIMLKNNDTLYGFVGGKENYESLKSFAAEHLSEQDIQGYNAAMSSGNMKLAEMAVLGLNAMAERERGRAPTERLSSDGSSAGNVEGAYESQQALIKDMNSRQYRVDPHFKATVDSRRAKSGF